VVDEEKAKVEREGLLKKAKTNEVKLAIFPFGTEGANAAPDRDDFTVSTSNKQLNFPQHFLTALKPGGRAGVVLPCSAVEFADLAACLAANGGSVPTVNGWKKEIDLGDGTTTTLYDLSWRVGLRRDGLGFEVGQKVGRDDGFAAAEVVDGETLGADAPGADGRAERVERREHADCDVEAGEAGGADAVAAPLSHAAGELRDGPARHAAHVGGDGVAGSLGRHRAEALRPRPRPPVREGRERRRRIRRTGGAESGAFGSEHDRTGNDKTAATPCYRGVAAVCGGH
jgi:hypothetical protein